ncbi:hypothetical protein Tco_0883497 [Tanacetum coccineum]
MSEPRPFDTQEDSIGTQALGFKNSQDCNLRPLFERLKYGCEVGKLQQKRLQAEFDEQERIEREKAKANIALKETWDDIQAKIEADQLLVERFKKSIREMEQTTKKAQRRSIMWTYLKNMEGWKPKDLKSKSFANIQELFNKAMKRVNTFVDYRTELVEGSSKKANVEIVQESSSKRAGDELEQESIKNQKVDKDKEIVELKSLMEVIPVEVEVAVC